MARIPQHYEFFMTVEKILRCNRCNEKLYYLTYYSIIEWHSACSIDSVWFGLVGWRLWREEIESETYKPKQMIDVSQYVHLNHVPIWLNWKKIGWTRAFIGICLVYLSFTWRMFTQTKYQAKEIEHFFASITLVEFFKWERLRNANLLFNECGELKRHTHTYTTLKVALRHFGYTIKSIWFHFILPVHRCPTFRLINDGNVRWCD